MKAPSIRPVRCAIYTRVSTEHGLDQEFNSLDAQYDAASAYIKSQAHAGWTLIRSRYGDGGYSGGSTDRPDLQRLLDDIRARKLDVIVVYKVDRLTRSLADFAKLVEPLGYQMKKGKIAIVEDEAERVRLIYRRYLELGGVNALVRDLWERNIRSKTRLLATGATRGGVPFGRGSLFYLLRNRFYVDEVKYKNEILPGEQPAIMDRALFDAVQQKLTEQWTTRSTIRNASAHLLTGLLFDDSGHRMVPTHATKAGVRYRYYVSLPHVHGESKTASVGLVSRVPATDIEDIVVNSLSKRLIVQKKKSNSGATRVDDRKVVLEQVARIDVYEDRLAIRLKSADDEETSDAADDHLLSIPWQKPPSRKSSRFLSRTAYPKVTSVRQRSNVARASSARSPEVVAGLTKSFRARSPIFNRSPHVKNAACARST
jgi:DNA invertase Pin-like site-specific DNA recombinase